MIRIFTLVFLASIPLCNVIAETTQNKQTSSHTPKIKSKECFDPRKNKELISMMGGLDNLQMYGKYEFKHEDVDKNYLSNKAYIIEYSKSLFKKADKSLKKDKEFVIKVLKKEPRALEFVDKSLLKDREVILTAIRQEGWLLRFADINLKADRELVKIALESNGRLSEIDLSLRDDPEILKIAKDMMLSNQDGHYLRFAGNHLNNDKDIVLRAVTENWVELEYAGQQAKDNKEIVLTAITSGGSALEYASPRLKGDKSIVMTAIKNRSSAVRFANKTLTKDKEVALAVLRLGDNLEYLDVSIKRDKHFVLMAVSQNGDALKYAAPPLQDDRDVVLAAINKSGIETLKYASERLKKDKAIVRAALKKSSEYNFKFVDKSLRRDKEIILFAIKNGLSAESVKLYVDVDLQKDQDIFSAIIKKDTAAIQFASDSLKKDKVFILGLINRHVIESYSSSPPPILKYIDDSLKNDREIVLSSVHQSAMITFEQLNYTSSYQWLENSSIIEYANTRFRKDKEIILAGTPGAFQFADDTLKSDKEFVLSVVKKDGYSVKYASKELRNDIDVIKAVLQDWDGAPFEFYIPCE